MLEACGEEIGALLDEEPKTSRDELAAEVRRLWAHAARNAAMASSRLSATGPFGRRIGTRTGDKAEGLAAARGRGRSATVAHYLLRTLSHAHVFFNFVSKRLIKFNYWGVRCSYVQIDLLAPQRNEAIFSFPDESRRDPLPLVRLKDGHCI
jgi:hypothetical protein